MQQAPHLGGGWLQDLMLLSGNGDGSERKYPSPRCRYPDQDGQPKAGLHGSSHNIGLFVAAALLYDMHVLLHRCLCLLGVRRALYGSKASATKTQPIQHASSCGTFMPSLPSLAAQLHYCCHAN